MGRRSRAIAQRKQPGPKEPKLRASLDEKLQVARADRDKQLRSLADDVVTKVKRLQDEAAVERRKVWTAYDKRAQAIRDAERKLRDHEADKILREVGVEA